MVVKNRPITAFLLIRPDICYIRYHGLDHSKQRGYAANQRFASLESLLRIEATYYARAFGIYLPRGFR